MWELYVETIIVPFRKSNSAALVVDSHGPHISDDSMLIYRRHSITSVQVPERMTGVLQPNDVGVYGPLSAIVSRLWLEQNRDEPNEWDSVFKSAERYVELWTEIQ